MAAANDLWPIAAAPQTEERFDPAIEAALELEETACRLDLEPAIVERLRHPERVTSVHLTFSVSGATTTFTGYHVRHSSARGPGGGPFEIGPELDAGGLTARAMRTTWQSALLDLPLGGGSGGIICDPSWLNEREFRSLARAYALSLRGILGADRDLLTCGPGANEQVMGWMAEQHADRNRFAEWGAVTGKPRALGGLALPGIALGACVVIESALGDRGLPLPGRSVVIHGFAETGRKLAEFLSGEGAKIIAVSDHTGAICRQDGLNIPEVLSHVSRSGMVFGYQEAEPIGSSQLIEEPCDCMVLAGDQTQINTEHARAARTALLVEAAPDAVTHGAAALLEMRGISFVPAILGSAGGIAAAYLEWSKDVREIYLRREKAEATLRAIVQTGYDEAGRAARRYSTNLGTAALLVAVDRVAARLRLA